MAENNVGISDAKLAKYLQIAANQRKRAVAKFINDYGPESATVAEVQAECAELDMAINTLLKNAAKGPHSSTPRK